MHAPNVPAGYRPALTSALTAAVVSLALHGLPAAHAQDSGAVPAPPEVQQTALASPQAVTKAAPTAALTAPPSNPDPVPHAQAVTIHLAPQPVAPPPVQPITFRVTAEAAPTSTPAVAAPVAAVPAAPAAVQAVTAEYRAAGPLRRAVGNLGAKLERVGHDRILVPRAQPVTAAAPQFILTQSAPTAAVTVPTAQTIVVQPAQKCRLFCH